MDLKTHLQSMPRAERERLAAACETTLGHLTNVSYGKSCSALLAAQIERHTKRAVMRWDLRPDDWHQIWPELTSWDGAPIVVVRSAAQAAA